MPDNLKVFQNEVDLPISGNGILSLPIVTTSASQQAHIKELSLTVTDISTTTGIFKVPLQVVLNAKVIASIATSAGNTISGTQIVDSSSSLTVSIPAETTYKNFGSMSAMVPLTDGTYLFSYDISRLLLTTSTLPTNAGSTIITNATKKRISTSLIASTSGFTIVKDGITYYCSTDGSQLTVRRADFSVFATINWGVGVYWACADGLYIYGAYNIASGSLKRIEISTWTVSDLALNSSIESMGTSNPGFMDAHAGFVYLRESGATATLAKINLTTGAVTRWGGNANATEHLGGLITVNTSGVPFLIEYGDANWWVRNLNTLTSSGALSQVWGTAPTTTNANTLFHVGPGIVLVANTSYSTSALIDVNGASPVATLATSLFTPNFMDNTSYAYMSTRFITTPIPDLTRNLKYSVMATGVLTS